MHSGIVYAAVSSMMANGALLQRTGGWGYRELRRKHKVMQMEQRELPPFVSLKKGAEELGMKVEAPAMNKAPCRRR